MNTDAADQSERYQAIVTIAICALLALLVWLALGDAVHHDFVNYDDNEYVYENPKITGGLTWTSVFWAFTHVHAYNWHPLTTISHMLDCQLNGLNPWGHHLTNVLLHTSAVILLFFALRKMTLGRFLSAFVAAMFAVHPLHVESVAWISERKDVLSGVFFMLTLWTYASYARLPGADRRRRLYYFFVVIFFALGLMSKPTLVTVPFVLLLLDYWPLGRMQSGKSEGQQSAFSDFSFSAFRAVTVEKIPLFVLSAGSCLVTVLAQKGAIEIARNFTLAERIANAAISYIVYLEQLILPIRLVCYYPFPYAVAQIAPALIAFLVLSAISIASFYWRGRYPFIFVGWFWYLGMLIPMIGVMQVGSQAHADRYAYLTQVGLYILLASAACRWLAGRRYGNQILAVASVVAIAALTAQSAQQTSYWQNGETLWRHTLDVTSNNQLAHNNLGAVLVQQKHFDEAISEFREAIDIQHSFRGAPEYVDAQNNLGNALMQSLPNVESSRRSAQIDEAIAHLNTALEAKPDFAEAWTNLATALVHKGDLDEAIVDYRKALEIDANLPEANGNLGNALLQQGKVDDAITSYQKAIELRPNYADAHYGLSRALIQKGNLADAIDHLNQLLHLDGTNVDARYQLGSTLLQVGKTREGIDELQNLIAANPGHPEAHHNLAVGLTQIGNLDGAIAEYQKAIQLRPGYAQAENNLGNLLLRQGNAKEAANHFQQAISNKPDYAEAYNDLGSAFIQQHNVTEAIANYQKAINLRPGYAEAHSNLGSAYLQNKEIDKAITEDRQAVALRPDSAPMQLNLGNALVAQGNRAEGITCYQTALRLQPGYAAAKQQLRKLGVRVSD